MNVQGYHFEESRSGFKKFGNQLFAKQRAFGVTESVAFDRRLICDRYEVELRFQHDPRRYFEAAETKKRQNNPVLREALQKNEWL